MLERTASAFTLLALAAVALGCGTLGGDKANLGEVTRSQQELKKIDDFVATIKPDDVGSAPLSQARLAASRYEHLLGRVRHDRPSGIDGDESTVWDTFIEVARLRLLSAKTLAHGIETGELTTAYDRIAEFNRRTQHLNDRFNEALGRIRGEKAPASQATAPNGGPALQRIHSQQNAIDARVQKQEDVLKLIASPPPGVTVGTLLARARRASVAVNSYTPQYRRLLARARAQGAQQYADADVRAGWRVVIDGLALRVRSNPVIGRLLGDLPHYATYRPQLIRFSRKFNENNARWQDVATRLTAKS